MESTSKVESSRRRVVEKQNGHMPYQGQIQRTFNRFSASVGDTSYIYKQPEHTM